jgi:hypothetical protein
MPALESLPAQESGSTVAALLDVVNASATFAQQSMNPNAAHGHDSHARVSTSSYVASAADEQRTRSTPSGPV